MTNNTLYQFKIAKIFFACMFLLSIAACDTKSCKDVVCPIDQSCNSGQCYCRDGYEGTDCQTLSQQKYIRNYNVQEICNPIFPFPTNNVFITAGSRVNEIELYNLMGGNCPNITAIIRTDNSNQGNFVEIPQQTCGGSSVYGQGTFDVGTNRIVLELYYTVSGSTYRCTTTLYPQ